MIITVRNFLFGVLLLVAIGCNEKEAQPVVEKEINQEPLEYAIVIHGGAGTILKENTTAEKEKEYTEALKTALKIGAEILSNGGSSLDAVEKTINYLEDNPLFNAGKGAVFTHDGTNELDASIMTSKEQRAGAVGGVKVIKNPISAARAVMEKSPHVMMVGAGAEKFAESENLTLVDPKYFYTESRYNSLQRVLEADKNKAQRSEDDVDKKHGTVGCVALDMNGVITAGTSTGGMTNKKWNRIGDSPIIGAGTYADEHCGISCTGHGEYFIRYTVASDIAARHKYKGLSIAEAADEVVFDVLQNIGGSGGVIALDKYGNITMPFNTPGMYRGYLTPVDTIIKIFKD